MKKMTEKLAWTAWAATVAVALSACADGAGLAHRAQMRDGASVGLPTAAQATTPTGVAWWEAFGDARLNRLVQMALEHNPSLKVAGARLERAQAWAAAVDSTGRPQLGANLDLTRQRFTETGMVPPPLAGSVRNTGTAQLAGLWELDFFGKHRAALASALGSAKAAQADEQAARVLLATQVARAYVQWARLNSQLEVAQRTLAQRQGLAQLVRERFEAGLDSQLELRQSEGGLPEARQQIEALREQVELVRNGLAALSGRPAAELPDQAPALSDLKPLALVPHIPADLLSLRADVAAARWRVQAGSSEVEQARARFYPNINLTAFAGFSSIGWNRLLQGSSEQWGVGPALHLPLFDGGYLRSNLRAKNAELDLAIETYNATVLEAMHEAADQIASLRSIAQQQDEQRGAHQAAEAAYAIALQRYEKGLANHLQVLNAESAVLAQRRLAADLQARQFDAQVSLVRALGGGYVPEAGQSPL